MGARKAQRTVLDPVLSGLLPPEIQLFSSTQIAVLWSSYGHIYRLTARYNDEEKHLILKHIHAPHADSASVSHARKLISYAVERYFYQHLASRLPNSVPVAASYPVTSQGALLLDDLAEKFPRPVYDGLGIDDTTAVLRWLAGFHSTFWGEAGNVPPPTKGKSGDSDSHVRGVWQQGTYWYLDTRREELAEVDDGSDSGFVLPWVEKINVALATEMAAGRSTMLHGDVKGENILFSPQGTCALVDFQYVGAGPPTLDLVYFLGTSIQERLLHANGEITLLRLYFDALQTGLASRVDLVTYTYEMFIRQWELAIVDWYRFMAGWGFWGNDYWVDRRAREIVERWEQDGFVGSLQFVHPICTVPPTALSLPGAPIYRSFS